MQLEVIQQKEVRFYEDDLTAVRAADGHVYVTIRQMCLAVGLDSQAQRRCMMRHTIIADGVKVVANLATTFGSAEVERSDDGANVSQVLK